MTFLDWQLSSPLAAALLLALSVGVLGWMRWRYGPVRLRHLRRLSARAGLLLLVAGLSLTAGDLRHGQPIDRRAIMVLVDHSASDAEAARLRALQLWKELRETLSDKDRLALAAFAKGVEPVHPFAPPKEQPEVPQIPHPREADGHLWSRPDLALRYAALAFPADYRTQTVLVTDGGGSTRIPATTGVISVASVPALETPDVALDGVLVTREGSELTVQAEAWSSLATAATLEIHLDGQSAKTFDYQLARGVTVLKQVVEAAPKTDATLKLVLKAEADGLGGNETLRVLVPYPSATRRIAIVDGSPEMQASSALVQALNGPEFDVRVLTPSALEAESDRLDLFDAAYLVDVSADQVTVRMQENLRDWVRAGGGLAMIGGYQSFALGGWSGSALESVLPVNIQPKDNNRPPMAIAILLDSSGSMNASVGSGTKLDQANLGAELSMRLVRDNDLFGVAQSTHGNKWIVPLAPLTNRQGAVNAIRRNAVGGAGISVSAALEDAYPLMANAPASDRMIVVFGDGSDSTLDSGTLESWEARVRSEVERNRTRLSVIAVGNGGDVPMLRRLAAAGRGTFVLTEDATQLPIIFSRASAAFLGGYLVEEPMGVVIAAEGELTNDLPLDRAPTLLGAVRVESKPGASTVLEAQGEFTLPLLVTRPQVAGRSLVFTSDVGANWTQEWMAWPTFAASWQRWTRWLAQGGAGGVADVEVGFAEGKVTLELFHREGLEGRVYCQLRGPQGDGWVGELQGVTRRSSRLVTSLDRAGAWRLTFWAQRGNDVEVLGSSWLTWSLLDESTDHAPQLARLSGLATDGGGGPVASAADVLAHLPPHKIRYAPANVTLAALLVGALMLLLVSRRFPVLLGSTTSDKLVEAEGTLNRLGEARREEVRRRGQALEREERLRRLQATPPATSDVEPSSGLDAERLLDAKRRAQLPSGTQDPEST